MNPVSLHRTLLALALSTALVGCATTAPAPAPDATAAAGASVQGEAKAERLDALYAQYWEELLELNPLAATYQLITGQVVQLASGSPSARRNCSL